MDQRVWKVWQEGQKDPQYMKLYQKMFELERRFEETMLRLDDEARDAVMDYVMHCEAMSWRMMEFACEQKEGL